MRIAVDAMGGDQAPTEIVLGVASAIEAGYVRPDDVILVGAKDKVAPLLEGNPVLRDIPLEHASQVVEMCDSPTGSLRTKPDSSIQVAVRLVQKEQAGAFVSAGNTGAVVACAASMLGRLPGVRRPGIAVTFPSLKGPVTILDVGANVHCKPHHLYQYGVMADIFSRDVLGIESPRVALLNIGAEEGKGNPLVRETRELFEQSDLNFVGNIEGNHLLSGECQVVVCEGFVGNVVLKVVEGVGAFVQQTLTNQVLSQPNPELAQSFRKITSKMDYAEYGGAPLLGVNGMVMIMHGRSDRRATANAMRASKQFLDAQVNQHIQRAIHANETDAAQLGDPHG